MLALLRVVLFKWILARIGLRWLLTLAVGVPIAILVFLGIPALLVTGVFLSIDLAHQAVNPL